jgi:hypothetical protein
MFQVLKTKTVHTDVVVIGAMWRSAAGIKVKKVKREAAILSW